MNKAKAFILITLTICVQRTYAQSPDGLVLSQANCLIVQRVKYSKAWSLLAKNIDVDTPVRVLGSSRLRGGPGYVFELSSPSNAHKNLEFKAMSSCFSGGASSSSRSSAASYSSPRSGARWGVEVSYAQHNDYFEDASTLNLDSVTTTKMGLDVRKVFDGPRLTSSWALDLGYGMSASFFKSSTNVAVINVVDMKTVGVGFTGFARIKYWLSNQWTLGLAVPLAATYAFWPATTSGKMVHKMTLGASLLATLGYRVSPSGMIYASAGVTENFDRLDARLGFEF